MKRLLALAFLLLLCSSAHAAISDDALILMRSQVIGDWTSAPEAKSQDSPFYASYKPDGTFEFVVYEDDCRARKFSARGVWLLVGTKLAIEAREVSAGDTELKPGMRITDEILEISDKVMVLKSKSGSIARRVHGRPCR